MVSGVMSSFSAVTLLTALMITPGFAAEGACKAGNEPECFAKSGTDGVGMVQRRMNISKHEQQGSAEIPPVALLNENRSKSSATCAGFDLYAFEGSSTVTAVVEIDGAYPEGTLMAFWQANMACAGMYPNPAAPSQARGWAGLVATPPWFGKIPFGPYSGKPSYGLMVYTNQGGNWLPYVFKFETSDGTMYDLKITAGGSTPPNQPYFVAPGANEIWMYSNSNWGNAVTPIKLSKA